MADDKKGGGGKPPDKKPAPPPQKQGLDVIVGFIVILIILSAIITAVSNAVSQGGGPTFFGIPLGHFISFFTDNLWLFKTISFTFSGLAIIGIIVLSNLTGKILTAEKAKLFPMGETKPGAVVQEFDPVQNRWQEILKLVNSTEPSNWRLAIIEADIMLDELLDKLNLPGETIGDKLKAVERSDFNTIDSAWEAHKARNMIAHQGSSFLMNQREARNTIALYEAVFKEFHLI